MEETIEKAIDAVFICSRIQCAKEEWPKVRGAVKNTAEHWIAHGPAHRANFALAEIERLDRKFAG
jgi:L-arabinose isomerase